MQTITKQTTPAGGATAKIIKLVVETCVAHGELVRMSRIEIWKDQICLVRYEWRPLTGELTCMDPRVPVDCDAASAAFPEVLRVLGDAEQYDPQHDTRTAERKWVGQETDTRTRVWERLWLRAPLLTRAEKNEALLAS